MQKTIRDTLATNPHQPKLEFSATERAAAPSVGRIHATTPRLVVGRRRRYGATATISRAVLDAVMLGVASVLAVALAGDDLDVSTVVLFAATAIVFIASWRAYTPKIRIDVLDDIRVVGASTAVAAMFVISVGAVTTSPVSANSVLVLWLFSATLLAISRLATSEVALRRRRTRSVGLKTLIVGAGQVGQLTARRFVDHPEFGLQPIGFLDEEPMQLPGQQLPLPVLGGPLDLEAAIALHDVDCVVMTFSSAPHDEFLDLFDECARLGVRALIVPRLFERVPSRLSVEHVGGLPLFEMHASSPLGFQYAAKYALDRIVSALLLLVLAPVLIVTAVAVRISLGRPILYRQRRVGLDGVAFDILKFRTMTNVVESEDCAQEFEPERAPGGVEGADRRTRVGSVLRATSLDELIQLFNVVKGDMSLVGPRPERPEYVEYFASHVHRYNDRHRVKSGITGWAQVNRLRGKTSIQDRVEWDNYYIENFSLWLDLKILLMTIPAILRVHAE